MKGIKIFLTVIVILLINIALTGFLTVTVKRPVVYYEYLFLPVVLILARKHFIRTSILIGIILLDLVYNLSHLYYFDLFNYLEKLPSLFISKFSVLFWILIVIGILAFGWICNYLIKLFEVKLAQIQNHILLLNIVLSILLFTIVYIIDALNGSTLIVLGNNEKPYTNIGSSNRQPLNIGKSLIKDVYTDYKLYQSGKKQVHEIETFKNINSDSSLAYKYFYNSNGNKEIVIVVESWGLLENSTLRKTQLAPFYKIDSTNYNVKFDSSYFDGATVQAESRELLNKKGEAYFSVINHNGSDIKGLVQKKVEDKYQTIAVQSFPGSYSLGSKFKGLIGFQQFKDYSFFHDTLHLDNSFNNHYTSVQDEQVFDYIFKASAKHKKSFTYCLTINTHLPFSLTRGQKLDTAFIQFKNDYIGMFPSEQTLERYFRMNQELSHIATLINNNKVDRVLIIGDHAPPFMFKEERKLFSPYFVPAIIIEKK